MKIEESTKDRLIDLIKKQQNIQEKVSLVVSTYIDAKGLDGDYELQQTRNGLELIQQEDN